MALAASPEHQPNDSYEIDPTSHTALRLQHASPEHIHLTTRRCFIGPIPEGWLKSHRKSWYRHYVAKNYTSKAATFTAPSNISYLRQTSGLDRPSASAAFGPSFPQPDDVDEEEEGTDVAGEAQGDENDSNREEDLSQLEANSAVFQDDVNRDAAGTSTGDRNFSHPHSQQRKDNSETDKANVHITSLSSVRSATRKRTFRERLTSSSSAKSAPSSSFHTAPESPAVVRQQPGLEVPQSQPEWLGSDQQTRSSYGGSSNPINVNSSTTALLPQAERSENERPLAGSHKRAMQERSSKAEAPGVVRFKVSDTPGHSAAKIDQNARRRSWRRLRQGQKHPGEIVKMEKMLVRVDSTMHELPPDYDENDSLRTEARTVEKWREFVVVCRESTNQEAEFSIQMYKTRVIPAKEQTHVQKRSTHEIPLAHKSTRVNLYSSLDKTLVIWVPWKKGTMIYILRTRSPASAVEWYTFIRQSLGWKRSTKLQVNVPDLSVSLQLENPFGELEASITAALAANSDQAALKTAETEKAVARKIIQQSLKTLEGNPEWEDVLAAWLGRGNIGLAWKRYDRLEWVHGANEQRMYGTLAMQRTHELELRPKIHYPTDTRTKKEPLTEPPPVEGFLIRLTSQKGQVRRLGKMYFKRLYFTTHNQYLCYCRPAKALPPPPQRLPSTSDARVPSASAILDNSPLIFAVNPYPEQDGQIEWLTKNAASKQQHDTDAHKEADRRFNSLLQAEGYINLSHVLRVQNIQRGNSIADENVDEGPDVDFHEEVDDTPRDDGKTQSFDDKRTFELVMKNKLVVRLQAYNEETKREWMDRLRNLVHYWKLRLADDMNILKSVRGLNLKHLEIDEEMEAYLGQFAQKWEVTRSVASPKLFHMCGISSCRAITMAGTLYRKPKRHSTFLRCGVILCHSNLLIFRDTLRERTGKEVRHIQHERQASIDLKKCYIYSGLVTESDLLYQNRTFDSNHPGHHALPRVYLEDGWTSTDEDTMTCFVIWQPRTKSWFKANEEQNVGRTRQRLRYVSRLGAPGRSIVFKTRSRAERDRWVLSIGMEIERAQIGEDIRVVNK
ncbi:MAG: hypothetical protein Q9163_000731 [Psora crenata]